MKIDLHDTSCVPFYRRISYLYIPALFVITSVLLEMLMFALMGLPFPPAYIFSLTIVLIIAALVSLICHKWLQTVICTLLLGWQLTTTISNIVANLTCMEIFSLETFKTISTAFVNAGSVKLSYWFMIPIIAVITLFVAGVVLVMWFCRLPRYSVRGGRQGFLCGLLAFFSFFSYTIAYSWSPNYQRGNDSYVANLSNQKFVYDTFSNRVASLYSFGSYSFYLDNLLSLMGGKVAATDVMDMKVNDFKANEFALPENEVLDEDYNLIMVLMETFERAAINPYSMPNLTEFMQQSCVEVNGYYSVERTCFTDHIGQTGMHVWGNELWSNYGDVEVPHSLANIFGRSGYKTTAFHDSSAKSYRRGEIFPSSLGFDEFNDFTTYDNPQYTKHCALNSDALLFSENLTAMAPADQPFYSYVICVSTHSTSASWCNLEEYYPEYFEYLFEDPKRWQALTELYPVLLSDDPLEVLAAKNYLVGTYSFDLGIGALLEYLKTTPDQRHAGKMLIETTALVMFGDHYYYVNPGVLKAESEDPRGLVGNRCPFIVYNPRRVADANSGLTHGANARLDKPGAYGETIYRFTSTMDIYSTVCSLFGIQTDQQMTYGHSIFDTAHGYVDYGTVTQSIGVGYLNGLTWGATGYDAETDTWQIWRTLDFVNFDGVKPSAEQLQVITPLVNRTFASIFLNTSLFEKDGFKALDKSKQYCLRAA